MRRIFTVTLWVALIICPSLLFFEDAVATDPPIYWTSKIYDGAVQTKDFSFTTMPTTLWYKRFRNDYPDSIDEAGKTDRVYLKIKVLPCYKYQSVFLSDTSDSITIAETATNGIADFILHSESAKLFNLQAAIKDTLAYNNIRIIVFSDSLLMSRLGNRFIIGGN